MRADGIGAKPGADGIGVNYRQGSQENDLQSD
jgi:hypothetical protein